LMLSQV